MMARAAGALAYRDYRWLWSGGLFSYSAQWINQVALGWLAYELTGSGTVLGAVLGARAVPIVLLAPLAGVAADRVHRRTLLIASQALFCAATAALALLIASGSVRVWHLFAFTFVQGTAHVFDRTSRQSAILDLVPREVAFNAVALNNVAFGFTRVLSPAVAGYLIAWLSAAANFFVQAGLYLLAIGTLLRLPTRERPRSPAAGTLWHGLTEGFRFAAGDAAARAVLLATAVPYLFLIPTWGTLLPVYAKDVLHAGPEGLGWLMTAVGVGALLGGVASTALGRVERSGWLLVGASLVFCAALLGVAASPSILIAVPFVMLAGIGEMVSVTLGQSLLQVAAPDASRGRVLSLLQFNPALISLGSVAVGIGVDLIGAPAVTVVASLAAAVATGALAWRSRALRELRLSRLVARGQRRH